MMLGGFRVHMKCINADSHEGNVLIKPLIEQVLACMGNELHHVGLPIQWFHTSRLAQSHVILADQIVYTAIMT